MFLNHVVLIIFWLLFCLSHSLLADHKVKQRFRLMLGKSYRYYRLSYNIFSLIFLVALIWFQVTIRSPLLFLSKPLIYGTGFLLCLSGVVIMLICIRKYFVSLSGLKSFYEESSKGELMITGLHKYVRHPLYLGTFIFIWGLFLIFPRVSLLIADLVITVYTLIGINLEEEKLIYEFGTQYTRYQHLVPKIIPFGKFRRKI